MTENSLITPAQTALIELENLAEQARDYEHKATADKS